MICMREPLSGRASSMDCVTLIVPYVNIITLSVLYVHVITLIVLYVNNITLIVPYVFFVTLSVLNVNIVALRTLYVNVVSLSVFHRLARRLWLIMQDTRWRQEISGQVRTERANRVR